MESAKHYNLIGNWLDEQNTILVFLENGQLQLGSPPLTGMTHAIFANLVPLGTSGSTTSQVWYWQLNHAHPMAQILFELRDGIGNVLAGLIGIQEFIDPNSMRIGFDLKAGDAPPDFQSAPDIYSFQRIPN